MSRIGCSCFLIAVALSFLINRSVKAQAQPQPQAIVPRQVKLPPEFTHFQKLVEAARTASNSPEFLDEYITPNFTARVEVRFKATLPNDESPEIDGTYIRVDGARPDGPPNVRARRYELRTDKYSGGIIVDGNKNIYEKNWRYPEDCTERDRNPRQVGCNPADGITRIQDALGFVLSLGRLYFAQYSNDHFETPENEVILGIQCTCISFSRVDVYTHELVSGRACFDLKDHTLLEYRFGGWLERFSNYVAVRDTLQPQHIEYWDGKGLVPNDGRTLVLIADVNYKATDGPVPAELLSPSFDLSPD